MLALFEFEFKSTNMGELDHYSSFIDIPKILKLECSETQSLPGQLT